MTKTCTKCGEEKPLEAFGRLVARSDGLHSHCRACRNAIALGYYHAKCSPDRVEKRRARSRQYYKEHHSYLLTRARSRRQSLDKNKERDRRLRRKYGIDLQAYLVLLAEQNGKCAICGRTSGSSRRTSLVVDHDHRTGAIRGLLCGQCNRVLGFVDDNPRTLRAALVYLVGGSTSDGIRSGTNDAPVDADL